MNHLVKIKKDLLFGFFLISIGLFPKSAFAAADIPEKIFESLRFQVTAVQLVDSDHLLITGALEDYRGISFPVSKSRVRKLQINGKRQPWWRILRTHEVNKAHAYKEVQGIRSLLYKSSSNDAQEKNKGSQPVLSRLLSTGAEIHLRKKDSRFNTYIPERFQSDTLFQGTLADAWHFMESIETRRYITGFLISIEKLDLKKEIDLDIQLEVIQGDRSKTENSLYNGLLSTQDIAYLQWKGNPGRASALYKSLLESRAEMAKKNFNRVKVTTASSMNNSAFSNSSMALKSELIYLNATALMKLKQVKQAGAALQKLLRNYPFSIYAAQGLYEYHRIRLNQALNVQ